MLPLLLFFLSGATALIYESLWAKYLALMFGSTVQAQTVVLAVFMGGLALGNGIFGRRASRLAQPLKAYGYIELAIGIFAFLFPLIYAAMDRVFIGVGSKIAENSGALLLLKGALSVGLLIAPTVLMGGTLPLLAAWLEQNSKDASRLSARFYSVNSLGAVSGAAVAGFYLVRVWGLEASLYFAGFANVLVAGAAIFISRPGQVAEVESKTAGATSRRALVLVAVTGGISMGLEVLASRSVGLIVGGSAQAFAIVLMAFILGIGLGAAVAASPRFSKWQSERTVYFLLLTAALVIGVFVLCIKQWAIFYSAGRHAIPSDDRGYVIYQLLVAGMAILALGIPAALLGAVLPMAIRKGVAGANLADHVGRLLTWNTIGAVAGVLLTGFVLMPMVGLRTSFLLLALAIAVVATVGLINAGDRRVIVGGAAVMVGLAVSLKVGDSSWRHVLGSGLYRLRATKLNYDWIKEREKEVAIHFYKDGPDATVAVETGITPSGPPQLILRINGKADASTQGDLPTQYLLGHLPFVARPESKDVFVLGFGSGITAGAVLGHPIDSLTIAENCGPVIEAAPLFAPWNRGVLTNAKTSLRREDARTVLKLSEKKYDAIISEPSNPWVAGIGSVFSQEFYQLCQSRLKEGGVMAQWFHIYEMHDGIVDLVVNTFSSVFPHFEIWEPENGDIILVGSTRAWESTPAVIQKLFERPQPRQDFEAIGVQAAVSLLAMQLASQQTAPAIAEANAIQTDAFPILEFEAPKAFFRGERAQRIFLFDERTRQSQLAPAVKRQTLRALPGPLLQSIWKEHPSANLDLVKYLAWRGAMERAGAHPVYEVDPNLPVIFRPVNSYPEEKVVTAQDVYGDIERLMSAEAALLRKPEAIEEPLKVIEQILRKEGQRPNNSPRYAASAARACVAAGMKDRAKVFIELGEKFEPPNVELGYLRRLLERN